jgi:hypothetical protein
LEQPRQQAIESDSAAQAIHVDPVCSRCSLKAIFQCPSEGSGCGVYIGTRHLRYSPEDFFEQLPHWIAEPGLPKICPRDQSSVERLLNGLPYEGPFDCADLHDIYDRSEWPGELISLRNLDVLRWHDSTMQNKDARHIAVPAKSWRNGHMELRWIDVGELMKAQRRLVAVHSLGFLVSVPRPKGPDREVWTIRLRKEGEAVNAAVLTDPVPGLHVVGMGVFCKPHSFRLLGREEALLCLSSFI